MISKEHPFKCQTLKFKGKPGQQYRTLCCNILSMVNENSHLWEVWEGHWHWGPGVVCNDRGSFGIESAALSSENSKSHHCSRSQILVCKTGKITPIPLTSQSCGQRRRKTRLHIPALPCAVHRTLVKQVTFNLQSFGLLTCKMDTTLGSYQPSIHWALTICYALS